MSSKTTKSKIAELQSKIDKDIERLNRKGALLKTSPAGYKAMIREKGYREIEKDTKKPVKRFTGPKESKELNRLIDFSKEYKRTQLK